MSRKPLLAIIFLLSTILIYGVISSGMWLSSQEIQVGRAAASDSEEIFINTSGTVPVTLNDLKPGIWYGPYKVDLYNPDVFGTLPVKYRIYDRLRAESVPGMYEHTDIKVFNFRCNGELYNHWEGHLPALNWDSRSMSAYGGVLEVKYTHCFEFNFKLENATDHRFEGGNLSFDLIFDAAQLNDPSW